MVPDVFRGGYFLFGDKQSQKRKVPIRSSRQHLIKNLIRVSGCTPAELESRVDGIGVVCEYHVEITQSLFLIPLNQEKVSGLPSDIRGGWVGFYGAFHTLFLLSGAARELVGTG